MCIGPFIVLLVLLVVNARGDVTTEPTEVQPAPCTVQLGEQTSAEGVHNRTFNDVAYCAFLGMRYAKPPVGELRFMDPVRLDDHPKGHHTYTAYGAMCAQFDDINRQNKVKGDEDCLFLNVFTPANQTKSDGTAHKYPVLVFIHGGSFIADSGEVHGVDLLMENELIVVTLNYRLGVLGFLKYEQRNITGNYGLKDQLAALEWVRRNVHHFGGDPERVTLMGHSAGAGAVTHHLYHERARDLFKGAIVLSGSMLAPWAVLYNTRRCLDNYLRDLPASTMDEIYALDFRRFFIRDGRFRYTFAFCSMFYTCFIPTLEDRPGDGAYFSKPPYELLRERNPLQIPILMSETSTEFEFLLPHVFDFWMSDNFPNNRHPTVKRQIGSILDNIGNWAVGQGLVASKKLFYQRMANMANLHYPIRRLMSEMAQRLDPGLLYYMRFEFDGLFGEYKKKIYASDLETDAYGAIHGDELGYIFSPYNLREAIANRSAYRRELSVHIRTVELVANFVKYGNPTLKRSKLSGLVWPAYNEANNHTQYLNVDEEFTVRSVDERQNLYYLVWQVAFECLYYSRCEGVSKLEQLSQTYGAPFATRHNDYDYELFDEDTKNNVT